MDKALFEEVLKMNKEMTNQNRQIKEQKIQIQTLEEMFKVLQPKQSEQQEEETKITYHGQEITVPIMRGDLKKLEINPEGNRKTKFNFTNLEEAAKILNI